MSLTPITSAGETRRALDTMLVTLRHDCQKYQRWIGWQGGSGEFDVHWNPRHEFWVRADETAYYGRWIVWFGNHHPAEKRMLEIVCEANPPENGINRQCAGLFLRDAAGVIYFAHSGKIGGGRKGIGKSAFLSKYRGALQTVRWPDGKHSDVIILGRIDGERFPAQVANFIREVKRFKTTAVGNGHPQSGGEQPSGSPVTPQFNQEFSGQRRGYRLPSEIEASCDHGLIINSLANALQEMGVEVANDQNRDLFVPARNGRMKLLFEAKTDVTPSTIYQAIGQLLYHSATQSPLPSLVMVLPATPNATTRPILDQLQIKVLVFDWEGQTPVFRNLTDIIE